VRRIAVGCVLISFFALALSRAASAGTYVDWECAGPTGAPAPAEGFVGTQTPGTTAAVSSCGSVGGQLAAGLIGAGPWDAGLSGYFTYGAPDDTRIAAVLIDRSTLGVGSSSFVNPLTYQINVDSVLIDGCLSGAGCGADRSGQIGRTGVNASALVLTAGCGGVPPNKCSTPIRLAVPRAAITLRDDIAPTIGNVRGSLVTPGAKRGVVNVEFDAADRGGGVYRMITTVDDRLFEVQPAAFGTCVDIAPANANPYEFAAKVPCPLTQAGLNVNVDTTRLSEGWHTIGVALEDAAGNLVNVVGPAARFRVRNARPNGRPAARTRQGRVRMWFALNRKTHLTTRVGRRVVTRGWLRDRRGRGIRGGEIEVYHFVRGHRRLLKTGMLSRKRGRVTLILPLNLFGDARGRRRIEFDYRAFLPGPVTSRANLFLTIRSRRGGPQTTLPGPNT
jgi:hypothetical protein